MSSLEDPSSKIYKLKKLKRHLGSQGPLLSKQHSFKDYQRRNYLQEKEQLAQLTAVTEEELAKFDKESRRVGRNRHLQSRQQQVTDGVSSTSPGRVQGHQPQAMA